VEHTNEIISAHLTFDPIEEQKLPRKLLMEFLREQGLELHGGNGIAALQSENSMPGPTKEQLGCLLDGLETGRVRFALRTTEVA
jgi:hypothetical protein